MPRRPRLDFAGFHHVVNRGVAQSDIYLCKDDKEVFLKILCKACQLYKVNLHDYCLMDNHYHLIIETTSENLSLFMRHVNSNYAIYFNKRYKRNGHLWQGRFKSWYILNEEYLYTLFRYIEHNPIKAKMADYVGQYEYTLLATLLNTHLKTPMCAQHSRLKKELHYAGVLELLEIALSDEELDALVQEQKKKIIQVEHEYKTETLPDLQGYFSDKLTKTERNKAILQAIDEGHTQASIANYLGLAASTIVKIKNRDEVK
ncbi:MAG: transposase [Helicobacteraceae bacterium]|jgi:putative transposase|nr:transposase [Helicobacteraceae bacterium]